MTRNWRRPEIGNFTVYKLEIKTAKTIFSLKLYERAITERSKSVLLLWAFINHNTEYRVCLIWQQCILLSESSLNWKQSSSLLFRLIIKYVDVPLIVAAPLVVSSQTCSENPGGGASHVLGGRVLQQLMFIFYHTIHDWHSYAEYRLKVFVYSEYILPCTNYWLSPNLFRFPTHMPI